MSKSQADYIGVARKPVRFATVSTITLEEYAENLLGRCVTYPDINEATARLVASEVPAIVRNRLILEISRVLGPRYRYPPLHYDGRGPSEEDREIQRLAYEAKICACAAQLRNAL